MNYDKEPDPVAVDLDDIFNNAKTVKQTKVNQLLKDKKGQRKQKKYQSSQFHNRFIGSILGL